MKIKRFPLLKFLAPLTLGLGGAILLPCYSAIAAPVITITPITWNVIGLDSNKPNVSGPDRFMAGARVCNVGDATATNITAKFVKDGGSNFVNLVGANTLSIPSLPAGSTSHPPGNRGPTPSNCYDFYFNLIVTRDTAAYSTLSSPRSRQQFHIEATATGLGTVSTPANRELYIEQLVSQARNAIDSITGPSTVYVGQIVQYTVNAHTAPGGYEQLSVLPLLPGFFQLISASTTYSTPTGATNNTVHADACGWENDPSSTYYHNNNTCNNPAITDTYSGDKAGDNITTVYTIKVLSTGSGALTNIIYDFSGSSYHYNADIGTGANIYAVTALPPQADLSITKTDNQSTANPGKPISYTITVTNNGPSEVTGATVTDTVPNTITNVSWICVASSGSSCGAASGTGNAINTTANLLSGGTATYTVTGTVSPTATGNVSNTASVAVPTGVTDPNTANNSSTDTDTIVAPDLTITKSHTGNFTQGSTGTYTITARNSGNAPTTGTVTVSDTLPTGLTPTAASGTGWTCTISGQTVTCTRSDALAAGASYAAISLNVKVATNAPASLTNIANISGGSQTNTTNDSASDPTTINGVPDLTISKSHTGNFTQGSTGTYTITATNSGGAATNGTVTVRDTLPNGLTPTAASGTGWTCTISGQTVTCTRSDTLAPGASYPAISLSVAVAANAASSITNTASIEGGAETNITNNNASDPTTIGSSADLSLTKTASSANPSVGQNVTFTITVSNAGPSTATGVTVTDLLPAGLTFVSATPSQGTYNNSTGIWTVGSVANGAKATLQVTATLTSGNSVTNTAEVTASGQPDPDSTPGNGVATEDDQASVTVASSGAKLLLVKRITAIIPANGTNTTSVQDDPGNTDDNYLNWPSGYLKGAVDGGAVKPGDKVEYTIYFLSNGGRSAQKVNMCDLIPTNTTFLPDAFGNGSGIEKVTGDAAPVNLTNTGTDTDGGKFVVAGSTQGVSCSATNPNGTVVIDLGDIPNSTAPGSPTNSYGFIRFRVKVN
jgi:uncharacterized repeat protein (TIGR01451 family)